MNPDNQNLRNSDKHSKDKQEDGIEYRDPLSRERKLADALLKRVDKYVDKHGLNDNTLIEMSEVFKHLISEFDKKVKLNNYCKKK